MLMFPHEVLYFTNRINFHMISLCMGLNYFGAQVLSLSYFSTKCGEDLVSEADSTWSGKGDRQLGNGTM